MTQQNKVNFIINVFYISIVSLIAYFTVRFLFVYLFPVIIGFIVTVIVQRPAKFLSGYIGFKKGSIALIMVILSYITIISLLVFLTLKLGTYVAHLASSSDDFINKVFGAITKIGQSIPESIREQLINLFSNFTETIARFTTSAAKNTAKFMPVFLTSVIVTIIASCYIAKDYDGFKASIASVIKPKYKRAINKFKILMQESIFKIIKGYLLILLITFAEVLSGLLLLRVKNALLYAVGIALLDLLPIFGTGTVLIPWGVIELVNKNYFLGAGLIILYLVIIIVRNIIEPKIIGKQIGLHPLITLIAVFIGLRLFGFIGIIALPVGVMIAWKMFEEGIFDILYSKE